MRHQMRKSSSFGRHRGPRKALIRGLVNNLVEKERIKTTVSRAKCVQPLIEKAVTMGKRGDIHSRRLLLSRYPQKKTVDKIINILSPRFKDRPGGYTRIIKLGFRSGDQAPLAYLEFTDFNAKVTSSSTPKESKTKLTERKSKKETKTKKEEKTETQKDSATKKTSSKKRAAADKASGSKKQKKQTLAKINKKRKRARQKQKKSRHINR